MVDSNSKLNMKSTIKFLLFIVIVFVFTSNAFSQVPNYVPTNGLVGYWPFNGNANDESGNGNNGTVNGAILTTDRNGVANQAYSFDGNDWIEVLDNIAFNFGTNTSFTCSFWIKYNSNMSLNTIISKELPSNPGDGYQIMLLANKPRFDFISSGPSMIDFQGITLLNDNEWHQVVFTANRTTNEMIFYIDGLNNANLINSNLSIGNLTNTSNLQFGAARAPCTTTNCYYNGLLDDISIYNRALTPQEITNLYTSTVPVSCLPSYVPTSGLVGYWPFCGNANDESGNGNNGTVNGATLTTDRFGSANSAYYFDYYQDIVTPFNLISGTQSRTISFWMKNSNGQKTITPIWYGGNSSQPQMGAAFNLLFNRNETLDQCGCWPEIQQGIGVSADWIYFLRQYNTGDNQWHFYSFVLANSGDSFSQVQIFVDGVLLASNEIFNYNGNASTTVNTVNNNPLVFGRSMANLGYPSDTQMRAPTEYLDDISIYNRALTPTEITQLYSDASVTPPVACTPFLGEDQTVCAGTSVQLNVNSTSLNSSLALLETYSHDVGSAWTHDFSVVPGQSYTVRVSAQFSMGTVCPNFEMDPAYWIPPYNGGVALTHGCNSAWYIQNYCNGALGMRPTPDVYNPQHTYDYPIVANSNVLTVGFADCCFGDNCGSISFELHQSITSSTYLWSNGATTTTINVSPTSTTTYTCTVTTNGVTCTDSVTVVVNNPTIDLGNDVTVCGTSTTLTAPTGFDSYLWSNGALTNTTTVTANGTYSCTVTQGLCSATDSIDVTLIDATITASDSTICAGETVTLSIPQGGTSNTACAALPTNLQTGLVGYWPFCGNANDDSGNGNNGTVNGATLTTDRFGSANSAYYFNGNSSYIKTSANGFPTNNRTITVWLSPENSTARIVCGYGGSGICGNSYLMNLNMYDCNGQGNITMQSHCCANVASVPYSNMLPNQWNMLTYVQSDTGIYYFINGTQVSYQASNFQTFVGPNAEFGIGTGVNFSGYAPYFDGNANAFFGLMDDISVYNRALSASEIQQLYNINSTTYLWSTGATTASINVTPTQTTTYTCTTTINGVSCTDSVTVVVNNPTIDLGNDVTACGTSTTLTAPAGYDSYLWSNGATTNTTTVTANGTYTCTVTQGLCSSSDSIDVTLIDSTISASDSTICAGETVTLSIPQGGTSNTACAALPSNLQSGLVGYWPFCGNANDESGNGNNGTVNGATLTTDRFGSANSAYFFDGINNNIMIPGSNSLTSVETNDKITISGWFKNQNFNPNALFSFGNKHNQVSDSGWEIILALNYADWSTDAYVTTIGNGPQGPCSPALPVDEWEHLTITYDRSTSVVNLFINGVNVCTKSYNYDINPTNNGPLYFGYSPGGPDEYSRGCLDEMVLYNRALSASDIQQLYTLVQTTYLWSNGATTPSISVSPTSTTTYTCTVITNGVSCTDSVTVVVNNPTIDLGNDVTVCGTSTTLTAPSGFDSYLWSNGATTNTTTVTSNGTYSCTVTQGLCSATDSIDIILIDATISASDSTICAGETVTLSIPQGGSSNTACAALPTNLQTGLVGYWPFCGNANDASGNGNNGTVNGATLTSDRFGNANGAYHFNGSSIITLNINHTDVTNYSLLGWVKSTSDYGGTFVQVGADDGLLGCNGFAIGKGGGTSLNNNLGNNLIALSSCVSWYPTSTQLNPAQAWHQFSLVKSNSDIKLFLDGVLVNTINNGAVNFPSPYIFIGGNGPNSQVNTKFFGDLDDITAINRTLSAAEIQEFYYSIQSTYLWSNGATTPTINVSPTSTTTYTCTTTINGVSCTDSVTVVVNNPTIDLGNDVTACGTSTTLTAPTGFDSYLWSNGAITNTTTVSASGSYSCTVSQGGCSASDAVDVTLIDATISATDSVICAGETATLSVPQGGTSSTVCAALPTNLQNGLVGYWPFCGNANDASGSGNNGIVNGATLTADRFGNTNSAYSFDGLSGIYCSMNAVPSGNQNRSLNLWIKTDNINQVNKMLAGYGNDSPLQMFSLIMYNPNALGKVAFWARDNDTPFLNSVEINEWTMFSVTYDGSAIFLYENGVLILSNDYSFIPLVTPLSSIFHIGDFNSNVGGFNGTIDDVSIYNRALSPSEIQQLYTLGQTTYLWSNGATTASISVTPTQTTTYTCTVTDANGNACIDSVTVVVNNPIIDLGNDVTVCGTSTTLTAPTGYDSYAWSNGGTTNTTTVTANGTYSCTVTQGGCSASDSIDVTLIDATISATDSIICAGETITLSVPQGGSSSTACPTLPTNLQTGLVGYWPFCGNANDESGNGNNGTVNGATLTTDRFGNAGSAYSFDGNSNKIITGSSSTCNPGYADFSISGWIKTTDASGIICSKSLGDSQQNPQNNDWYVLHINSGKLEFELTDGYSGPGDYVLLQSTITINDGLFHFFTFVFDRDGNGSIYIDNVLNSSTSISGFQGDISPLTNLEFGYDTEHLTNYLFGVLDDINYWNRIVTEQEITQLYNIGQATYTWTNGATTPTINVSPTTTTTYTCTVTTNGVSCSSNYTITVNNSSASTNIVNAFDSFTWLDGNTYTASNNTATYTTTNAAGCDSVISLNLTITPSSPTLSLQVFLDGYYTNSSNPAAMTAARYNNLVASGSTTPGAATDVDVITVELRSPYNLDVVLLIT